jgi:hypothetical protein
MDAIPRNRLLLGFQSAVVLIGLVITADAGTQEQRFPVDWSSINAMEPGEISQDSGSRLNGGPFRWVHGSSGRLWVEAAGTNGCPPGKDNCLHFTAPAKEGRFVMGSKALPGSFSYLLFTFEPKDKPNWYAQGEGVWLQWRERRAATSSLNCGPAGAYMLNSKAKDLRRINGKLIFNLVNQFQKAPSKGEAIFLQGFPVGRNGSDANGNCIFLERKHLRYTCKQGGPDDQFGPSGWIGNERQRGGQTKTMLNRPSAGTLYPWLMVGFGTEFRDTIHGALFTKDYGQAWWGDASNVDFSRREGVLIQTRHWRDTEKSVGFVSLKVNEKKILERLDPQLGSDNLQTSHRLELGIAYQQNCASGSIQEVWIQGLTISTSQVN